MAAFTWALVALTGFIAIVWRKDLQIFHSMGGILILLAVVGWAVRLALAVL